MSKPISSLLVNIIRFRSIPWLTNKLALLKQHAFSGIGESIHGTSARKALLIFPTNSLAYIIRNQYEKGVKKEMHNIYFQGLAMVDRLVKKGFVVDCMDAETVEPVLDVSDYYLIIDESNNLPYLRTSKAQKKIFFSTGLKWDRSNTNELDRIKWFNQKYNIYIRPIRQVAPNFTDEIADYILYKGELNQLYDMNQNSCFFQLSMPVDFEPETVFRDYSKKEFLWVGGYGALHKGLDIVVDAFAKLPNYKLNLFGSFNKEPDVMDWLTQKLKTCSNIKYHGFAEFPSSKFQQIVKNCIAHVYPSASENGCATLAQTAHFGVLPITTPTASNQSCSFGWTIKDGNREELIESTIRKVKLVSALSEDEIEKKSKALMAFAKDKFTRQAFINSFDSFLNKLEVDFAAEKIIEKEKSLPLV